MKTHLYFPDVSLFFRKNLFSSLVQFLSFYLNQSLHGWIVEFSLNCVDFNIRNWYYFNVYVLIFLIIINICLVVNQIIVFYVLLSNCCKFIIRKPLLTFKSFLIEINYNQNRGPLFLEMTLSLTIYKE